MSCGVHGSAPQKEAWCEAHEHDCNQAQALVENLGECPGDGPWGICALGHCVAYEGAPARVQAGTMESPSLHGPCLGFSWARATWAIAPAGPHAAEHLHPVHVLGCGSVASTPAAGCTSACAGPWRLRRAPPGCSRRRLAVASALLAAAPPGRWQGPRWLRQAPPGCSKRLAVASALLAAAPPGRWQGPRWL